MRLGYFAREMAKRGHHVVLLTCALPGTVPDTASDTVLSERLREHDWATPLVLAVQPRLTLILKLIRENRLPALARRALTLWQFLRHGGVFADWQIPALPVLADLAREFCPELVWATFGNTSNLFLARSLAQRAKCSWLMDIKDNWEVFVPFGLRRLIAWRVRGAAGWTTNAAAHAEIAARWLRQPNPLVVYSGVADDFYVEQRKSAALPVTLLLVGSTYSEDAVATYLIAVAGWLETLPKPDLARIRFVYAGSDTVRLNRALKVTALPCKVEVLSNRSIRELAWLAQNAFANSYLRYATTFHHKLLELLVCGRPVICYPGEALESMRLVALTDTLFLPCDSIEDLRRSLAQAWDARSLGRKPNDQLPWRWENFAGELEELFESTIYGQLA